MNYSSRVGKVLEWRDAWHLLGAPIERVPATAAPALPLFAVAP
jgi:hypothetical protein